MTITTVRRFGRFGRRPTCRTIPIQLAHGCGRSFPIGLRRRPCGASNIVAMLHRPSPSRAAGDNVRSLHLVESKQQTPPHQPSSYSHGACTTERTCCIFNTRDTVRSPVWPHRVCRTCSPPSLLECRWALGTSGGMWQHEERIGAPLLGRCHVVGDARRLMKSLSIVLDPQLPPRKPIANLCGASTRISERSRGSARRPETKPGS